MSSDLLLDPAFAEQVREGARTKIMEVVDYLIKTMIVNDRAIGERPISREDRVLLIEDLSRTGVLQAMLALSPQLITRVYVRQYERDIAVLRGSG